MTRLRAPIADKRVCSLVIFLEIPDFTELGTREETPAGIPQGEVLSRCSPTSPCRRWSITSTSNGSACGVPDTRLTSADLLLRRRLMPGMIPPWRWADLPDVDHAPGLAGAPGTVGHGEGERDPRASPPARRAPTAERTAATELGRPCPDRRAHPTTPHVPPPRAARHPGHDPALAPPADYPPLDNDAQPARATRHPRRSPGPGPAPGRGEPAPGDIDDSTARQSAWATESVPPPSGLSCTTPVKTPHPDEPDHRGRSFCAPTRTRSSPATCFTLRRSPCAGWMSSSSSSTPPATCTSSGSPPTPPEPG